MVATFKIEGGEIEHRNLEKSLAKRNTVTDALLA